jgi:hypothetical protein
MSSVPLIFSLPALMHAKVSEATPEVCVVKRFLDPGRARKTKAWLLMPFGAQCQVKSEAFSDFIEHAHRALFSLTTCPSRDLFKK